MHEQDEWIIEEGVTCAVCPGCAFTFDAIHTDADGRYSCPYCRAPEIMCPACGVERADYEGPDGAWLPTCPNCRVSGSPESMSTTDDLVTLARLRLHGAEPNGHPWAVRNNQVDPEEPHGDLFVGGGTTGSYPVMVDGTCSRASDIAWFIAEAPTLIRRLCDALDAAGSSQEADQ